MRAHTTHTNTTMTRPRRKVRYSILPLALGVCALAIPASAAASPVDGYSSVNAITGGLSESSQPPGGSSGSSQPASDSDYSSLNAITGSSESSSTGASQDAGSGYSSLNAITGPLPSEPTLVTGSPADTADGFDWGDAALGAGAAMALVAFGGAAFLTVRRRMAMSPSGSAS